jgi:hypothetical protein
MYERAGKRQKKNFACHHNRISWKGGGSERVSYWKGGENSTLNDGKGEVTTIAFRGKEE